MAKDTDVFGADELEKSLKKMLKKFPDETDALLMSRGQALNKSVKKESRVYKGKISPNKVGKLKPGQLKKSWRLKKVKAYKQGKVRVVRVQSGAPHAHLIEYGHELYRGGKVYVSGHVGTSTGRRGGYKRKLDAVQRSVRGIKHLGRVEGAHTLEYAVNKEKKRFPIEAEKMLNKVIKDFL